MHGEGDRFTMNEIIDSQIGSGSPLETIKIDNLVNPKPPYECEAIRTNPDLTKLQEQEPILFQEDYEKYVMKDGKVVYTREIDVGSYDAYEDEEQQTELDIISIEEYNKLPAESTGELAKFRKEIEACVWKARGNGINHYSKWYAFHVFYTGADMFKKIDVPKLEFRVPVAAKHSMDEVKN